MVPPPLPSAPFASLVTPLDSDNIFQHFVDVVYLITPDSSVNVC